MEFILVFFNCFTSCETAEMNELNLFFNFLLDRVVLVLFENSRCGFLHGR